MRLQKIRILNYLWCLLVFTTACKSTQPTVKKSQNNLTEVFGSNPLFKKDFSGIHIEKIDNGQVLYQQFANHRFIPASNVKILTLYAAIKTLDKKIPTFHYESQGDTLWLWGTGDPAFLYDKVQQDFSLSSFLAPRKEQVILFSESNFKDERFGSGWAWDDYPYAFQVEKTPLPIYGNRVIFQNTTGRRLSILPIYFEQNSILDPTLRYGKIIRAEMENQFSLANDLRNRKFKMSRPFKYEPNLISQLLTDTLKRKVELDISQRPLSQNSITIERNLSDELYQRMMQQSDNFLAEQLLLTVGGKITDTLNTKQAINKLERTLFKEIREDIRWVDGSGLSRYNLLTPNSIAWTLRKLSQEVPRSELLNLFPAGGQSGSLKNWFGGKSQPYVFAKTGSMSGVYCLSGYLKTKKGELLIISFMHNNFRGSSRKYKEAITPVLEWLHENL